jgi:dihydrofolate reductase
MARLSSFLFATLNGYFEGSGRDISWHSHDAESDRYSNQSLTSGSALLFGRLTYDLMAGFWPTLAAAEAFPLVAPGMNAAEKIVFSRTMKKADWAHTRVVSDLVGEVRNLKESSTRDMTILGSGSIVSQLAERGLIDEFQIMLDPVVLRAGTPLFKGISQKLELRLASARPFKNGSVLLTYNPAGA